VNLVFVFVYALCLTEHLMSFAFCFLPISGSSWYRKEEKEMVTEIFWAQMKANSWIWKQKLKISKDDWRSTKAWESLEFGSKCYYSYLLVWFGILWLKWLPSIIRSIPSYRNEFGPRVWWNLGRYEMLHAGCANIRSITIQCFQSIF
jgi:hypothetical protein